MATDFAKTRKNSGKATRKKKSSARQSSRAGQQNQPGGRWRAFLAGLLSGVFLSFLLYLGTLPPVADPLGRPQAAPSTAVPAEPPKPRFDFYTMLPEQTLDGPVEPAEVAKPPPGSPQQSYLLQAGSFRQRDDADRRRAELLLLGLEPRIEEAASDNGRWFRVYLGPFDSHASMSRARGLTAAQDIDTLLLKRGTP